MRSSVDITYQFQNRRIRGKITYDNWQRPVNDVRKDQVIEELNRLIEEKIRNAGYPGEIDGREFYNEVSDEADDQEEGTYIFGIKKSDTLFYQGCMEILKNQFDLHYVDIHDGETVYHVDFDAQMDEKV